MNLTAVTKTYLGRRVLELPPLELEDGCIHAIIGANGSGKSTMAKILAGVLYPDSGLKPLQCQAGYMPQRNYPFHMTVLRNLQLTGASREQAIRQLKRFGLNTLARQNACRLSGGEMARLAMARLLMKDYSILILDEPTAAMDVAATLLAESCLMDYHERTGCTILLVTHSLTQACRIADHIIFLKDGRIIEQGTAKQVLFSPLHQSTKAFLDFYSL